jgi:YbbR domain-containing protein
MIRFLRDLLFRDVWLKLFSLALAVLIWLTVSFAIKKEGSPVTALTLVPEERTFSNLPVLVMSSAQDVRDFKVRPSVVEVTVRGEARSVRELQNKDIRVIVDVTGIETAQDLKKRIEVTTLAGISLVRVAPQQVEVIFPPKS